WPERRERIEALGPCPLAVALLVVARAHVVEARESGHMVERALAQNGAGAAPDHDRELALGIEAGDALRVADRLAAREHGARGFEEEQRLRRRPTERARTALRDVRPIVEAHAHELGGNQRDEQPHSR